MRLSAGQRTSTFHNSFFPFCWSWDSKEKAFIILLYRSSPTEAGVIQLNFPRNFIMAIYHSQIFDSSAKM